MVGIYCNHTAQQRGDTYIVDFELCFHFLRLVVSGQLVEHCPGPATSHHRGRRKLISSDVAVIAATRAQCRRRVPEPCAQQSRWKHIHKSHRKKGNQSVVRTCSASGILKNNRDTIPFTAIAAPLVLLLLLLLLSGLIEAWGLINYIFRTTIEDAEWRGRSTFCSGFVHLINNVFPIRPTSLQQRPQKGIKYLPVSLQRIYEQHETVSTALI